VKSPVSRKVAKYVMIAPALALAVLFFFIPAALLFMVSVTEKGSFFYTPILTTINYVESITIYGFDFRNTLTMAAGAAFLDVLFAYPFAYLMTRKIRRFADVFRSILLFPLFGELYIAFGLWYLFLPGGPMAFILRGMGLSAFEALYSVPSAVAALAIFTFPFAVLQIGVALSQVDPVVEEAAMSLGAGPIETLFRIVIPLSGSGILSGWLMSFGWNIGAFAIPILMGGAIVGQRVLSVQIRSIALLMMDYGLASALAVTLVMIALATSYVSIRASKGALM